MMKALLIEDETAAARNLAAVLREVAPGVQIVATLEQLQTMEAHREAMRKARAEQAEKMKSILSTEQFMEWSKMQGPHPGARRGPQMMRKAPEGPACREGACCDRPCPREKMKGKK